MSKLSQIAVAILSANNFWGGNFKLQGNQNAKHNPKNNKRTKPKRRKK